MKFIANVRNLNNGNFKKVEKVEFDDLNNCLNYLMKDIFLKVGNGDGENGGEGSLWRCAKKIYDCLKNADTYSYAEYEWWIDEMEDKGPKKYLFHFSTVLNTSVEIEGNNYKEAKLKAGMWATEQAKTLEYELNGGLSKTTWEGDGEWCDEGEEEIKS